jgi:hypothetical protein
MYPMYPGQFPAQRMPQQMQQQAFPQQMMPASPVGGIASLMPQQMAPQAQQQMPFMQPAPVYGMAEGGAVTRRGGSGKGAGTSGDKMQLATTMRTGTPDQRMAALQQMRGSTGGAPTKATMPEAIGGPMGALAAFRNRGMTAGAGGGKGIGEDGRIQGLRDGASGIERFMAAMRLARQAQESGQELPPGFMVKNMNSNR